MASLSELVPELAALRVENDEVDQQQVAPGSPGADDMTCAICLESIQPAELAVVKGCMHTYCACCVLQWALRKETCPQCKTPFNYLYVHRMLDGTMSDYPVEESVCLLKRAAWFEEYLRVSEKGHRLFRAEEVEGDDSYYQQYYDEIDEEDEIENFYFSSAAGRARIVIGNRRWGENGSVRAGRMYARPVGVQPTPTANSNKIKGRAAGAAAPASSAGGASVSGSRGNVNNCAGSSSSTTTSSSTAGCSGSANASSQHVPAAGSSNRAAGPNKPAATPAAATASCSSNSTQQGRRAKRNARRAVIDCRDDDYDY